MFEGSYLEALRRFKHITEYFIQITTRLNAPRKDSRGKF